MLAACGGSDEAKTTPVAQNDNATSLNNQPVTISVLQNDTDKDGDSISLSAITVQPVNGNAEISGNQIIYTPNLNQFGSDSLSYQISDGENLATASVTIENTQTLSLSGTATDSPLANANVVVTINGDEFETTTNQDGEYSIEIALHSFEGNILIKAQGAENSTQSQASLFSLVGSVEDVISAAAENRQLDEEELVSLKLNQLTTAKFLLALANKEPDDSLDSATFASSIDSANSTDMLELAGFIKLIIDNDNYSLTENQTLESFFISTDNNKPNVVVREYLLQNELINASGDYDQEFSQALNLAVSATAVEFAQPLEASYLVGRKFVVYVGDLQEGFIPRESDIYEFTTATRGIHWRGNQFDSIEYEFSWSLEQGRIQIEFDLDGRVRNESFPDYNQVLVSRFGEEAVAKATEIEAGVGFPSGQVRIGERPSSEVLTLIASNDNEYQILRSRADEEVLFLNDDIEIFEFTYEREPLLSPNTMMLATGIDPLLSQEVLVGQWLIHSYYEHIPDIQTEEEYSFVGSNHRLNADTIALMENNTALTQYSKAAYTWQSMENGTIKITNDQHSIEITPILEVDDGFLATFVEMSNGKIIREYVREFFKLDDPVNSDYSSLITSGTQAYISLISATQPRAWESGMLDIDYVFAYQFYESRKVDRVETSYESYDSNQKPFFQVHSAWIKRDVTQSGDTFTFSYDGGFSIRQRTWRIVKTDEAGRIWAIESFFFTRDENENGVFDRFSLIIQPRLTSFIKVDLQDYEEVWANSDQNTIGQP